MPTDPSRPRSVSSATGSAVPDPARAVYGLISFVTLAGLALTEQFTGLVGAAVALGSGWLIVRSAPPGS